LKERAIRISYELQNFITSVAVCHQEHSTAGRARLLRIRPDGCRQREDCQKRGRFIGEEFRHQRFLLSKVDLSGRSEVASYCGFDEGRQKSRSMQQNSPANVQRSDEQMCLLYGPPLGL
jgi:hypothetical protein